MKKLFRKLIPVVLIVAAILPASSAFAAPVNWYQQFVGNANGIEVARDSYVKPKTLLLREETPVYADAGDAEPIGALAPQIVYDVEAYEIGNLNGIKWYKVETWLGKDTWIRANRAIESYVNVEGQGKTSIIVDYSNLGSIRNNKTLYADAFLDTAITWASLAPQNYVEVVAHGNGMAQIRTWIGLYWIASPPPPPGI
jgi:hypothetical protein